MKPLSALLTGLIRLYQLTLGVILPPSCRFSPSCSHYAIAAIRMHGPLAGVWLALTRIGRCHPWGGCGHDPVPDHFSLLPGSKRHSHAHDQ